MCKEPSLCLESPTYPSNILTICSDKRSGNSLTARNPAPKFFLTA